MSGWARHRCALSPPLPRGALITYGAPATTADGEQDATAPYERAESLADNAGFPFELARIRLARIRLARGIRVRHAQGPKAARQTRTRAAEAFERLGATPWANRARAELRASRTATRPSSAALRDALGNAPEGSNG
ncbi:hypothetical protein GCM10010495_69340 [Kitasatospora herbaricolor]|uniref:hypothetical protein n=1 Tax=Kitasatospora herbaricolor TaxID=68217 RepID=UPI00174D360B|nr:hypothetical protein [Kitasatospora herbaricolor]MDQ0306253.1 hypothetical protein [Kitasatospora herbaricolor]GGV41823.1 hypothetical protein GCM10010495_69340 [Kitasatospora herbaricolor]